MKLIPIPITLREANDFVRAHHRHSKPVRGWRFGIGAGDGEVLWGVAIVGRPVSRALQNSQPGLAEVTRNCAAEGAPKGTCSFLYAACWRAWRAMGGTSLITYTLLTETGASLRGAGWRTVATLPAKNGKAWQSRPGRAEQPSARAIKRRWEIAA